MQLLALLSILCVIQFARTVPVHSDQMEDFNQFFDDDQRYPINEDLLVQRPQFIERPPMKRRGFPSEGILLGKRGYPSEGILLGKRRYPSEGILLGKRYYPGEGILLGKRDTRN